MSDKTPDTDTNAIHVIDLPPLAAAATQLAAAVRELADVDGLPEEARQKYELEKSPLVIAALFAMKSRLAKCQLPVNIRTSDVSPELRGTHALRSLSRIVDGIYDVLCTNCSAVVDPVARVHSMAAGSTPTGWVRDLRPDWIRGIQSAARTLQECVIEKEQEARDVAARESSAANRAKVVLPQEKPPGPIQLLFNWSEVLEAVGLKNNSQSRSRVAKLNNTHDGPIILPKRGGQPTVDKAKLLEWWNCLETLVAEREQKDLNASETVRNQYKHGKESTVIPGIAGHTKRRRGKPN